MKTLKMIRDDYAERDEKYENLKKHAAKFGIEVEAENEEPPQMTEIIDKTREKVVADTGEDIFDARVKQLTGNAGEFHPASNDTYYDESLLKEDKIDENFAHVAEHEAWHAANDNHFDGESISETGVNEALTELATKETTGKTIAYAQEIKDIMSMTSRAKVSIGQMILWYKSGTNSEINRVIEADKSGLTISEFKKLSANNENFELQKAA